MRSALLGALVGLVSCGLLHEREVLDPSAVRGVARASARVALSPGAVVTVQLEDMSVDEPPLLVGEQRIVAVQELPVRFSVHFEPTAIDASHTYRLVARVLMRDQLVYVADSVWVTPAIGLEVAPTDVSLRPVITAGAPPGGFRGIAWGGWPTATLARASGPSGAGHLEIYRNRASDLEPFLGVPVEDEAYSFAGGQCFGGQLRIRGEDSFATVLQTLTARYGPPEVPQRDVFVWRWPSAGISVTLAHASKWEHTTVTMTNASIGAARAVQAASVGR